MTNSISFKQDLSGIVLIIKAFNDRQGMAHRGVTRPSGMPGGGKEEMNLLFGFALALLPWITSDNYTWLKIIDSVSGAITCEPFSTEGSCDGNVRFMG